MSAAPPLETIASVTRETVRETFNADSCIASSIIGQKVLAEYGITSRLVTVSATAYNDLWVQMRRDGIPPEEWPENAWSLGIVGTDTVDHENNRWDGHLVLVLRWDGRRLLLDLSADQMSRPERDLVIPGPIGLFLPRLWTPQDPGITRLPETNVTVEYVPRLGAEGWKQVKDAQRHEQHTAIAEESIRRVNLMAGTVPR